MKILNDFYMDNSITSSDCSEKCVEFYLPIKIILKEENFKLQKMDF